MKKIYAFVLGLLGVVGASAQQDIVGGAVRVNNLHVAQNDSSLFVSMTLDVTGIGKMGSNRQMLLTPALVAGTDTVRLNDMILAGRNRWYAYVRNPERTKGTALYRVGKIHDIVYKDVVPYQTWMEKSSLVMLAGECACLNRIEQDRSDVLAALDYAPYDPALAWVVPNPGKDSIVIEGQALVEFRVNRTELDEHYRNNIAELGKILHTIDVVKNDPDCSITHVHIKGHASPEGLYANNVRLAEGRTATLKQYVRDLYHFADSVVTSSFEPEDWAGLRDSVKVSALPNKEAILQLIDDGSMKPDLKDWTIKRRYARDYAYMLAQYYPALRRSDYRVVYKIRDYTDIEEAKRIFNEAPAKLSLRELFDVANTYQPGSEEFQHVLETAALLYPDSEVANLNAANAAIVRKNYEGAAKYLQRAGDMPQTILVKGILAVVQSDYSAAQTCFEQAARAGVKEAEANLKEMERMKKRNVIK